MASSQSTNPFYDKDDTFDSFNSSSVSSRTTYNNYGGSNYKGKDPFLDDEEVDPPLSRYEILQQQKQASMNRQLEGTNRALTSLHDSERMGIATAEELTRQGEQLDNVETKLDTINQDLKSSQRHLNGIKSVFGGIKNWWKGTPQQETVPEKPPSRRPETSLTTSLETSSSAVPSASRLDHPGLRDTKGVYGNDTRDQQQQQSMSSARDAYETQLDGHLDEMSAGLSRLKGLGLGLGEEIHAQNDQIDRISNKADRSDITIKDQNRQMRKVLGK